MARDLQPITVYIAPDLISRLERMAEDDDRSLSAYIRLLLERHDAEVLAGRR